MKEHQKRLINLTAIEGTTKEGLNEVTKRWIKTIETRTQKVQKETYQDRKDLERLMEKEIREFEVRWKKKIKQILK